MSRPIIDVDEDDLRSAMIDVPAMRNRKPAGAMALLSETGSAETASDSAAPESPVPVSPPAVVAAKSGAMPATEDVQAEPIRSEPTKRGPYRKKRPEDEQAYRDMYLVNDGVCLRVSSYINRDTHEKIKILLFNAAPDISIVSYINNILNHHLDQHKELLDRLFRSGPSNPFQS